MSFTNDISVKILSPVHIGSGEECTPIEYLIDSRFHRLNMNTLMEDREFKPLLEEFIKTAPYQRYIGDFKVPHETLKRHILYSLNIDDSASDYLNNHKTNIKTYIKSAGRSFIPGSSLKGSILSALFWAVLKEESKKNFRNVKELILRNDRSAASNLQDFAFSLLFNDPYNKNKFSHWMDVGDSDLKSSEEILKIILADVEGKLSSRTRDLRILYESLKPDIIFTMKIGAAKSRFTLTQILDIADQFYRKVLEKDKVPLNPKGKLLRLGQGSSAFATSLLLLAQDLGINEYNVKPPKTRKRIDHTTPMGWVEVTIQN